MKFYKNLGNFFGADVFCGNMVIDSMRICNSFAIENIKSLGKKNIPNLLRNCHLRISFSFFGILGYLFLIMVFSNQPEIINFLCIVINFLRNLSIFFVMTHLSTLETFLILIVYLLCFNVLSAVFKIYFIAFKMCRMEIIK